MMETPLFKGDEYSGRRSVFNLLVKDWLSIIFEFLSANKFEDEMHKARKLSMFILKDNYILKNTWK